MSQKDDAARLLIVEDDPQLSTGLQMYLEAQGYRVTVVATGAEGLEQAAALPGYDLLILDGKLPGKSGFDILREIRSRGVSTPVLMLTGLGSHEDRMRGYELGADDYLTKPFSTEELLARVQAILRRSMPDAASASGAFAVGGLTVHLDDDRIERSGQPVELTDLEYRLLRYFIIHRGRTVSRKQLLRDVWNLPAEVETRTIDRHVNALRKVMDGEDEETWPIRSVYGIGYKLVGAEQVQATGA